MQINSILLTSDDGYNSIGIRILANILKHDYDLAIVATKNQCSGHGGKMNFSGGEWGQTMVDGVPAIWVDGSPADAAACAASFYKKKFDLVISGINIGPNVGEVLISSGTFCGLYRCLSVGVSDKGLALSWLTAGEWFTAHNGEEDLSEHLIYPGKITKKIIDKVIKDDLYGANILNINFPEEYTKKVKFTSLLKDQKSIFPLIDLGSEGSNYFGYPAKLNEKSDGSLEEDLYAIRNGFVSITPCQSTFLDKKIYQKIKDLEFKI